jgi:ParB family chromosome partitioning protein
MQVLLEDVKVKKRIRRDMGDISSLADSMKRFGQITPILLSKSNVLIAGGRRLAAARLLGWRTINAVIADIPENLSQVEYEAEENFQRRDFTPEETAEATRRIYKIKNPGLFRSMVNALIRFFKKLFKLTG